MMDASVRTLEATGTTLNDFTYDSYSNELKIAGLGSLGYSFRGQDQLSYTFFMRGMPSIIICGVKVMTMKTIICWVATA